MFVYYFGMAIVLYKRQKEVLDFIIDKINDAGSAPTLVEIADNFGLSSLATVHEHLSVLEKKGFIRRYKGAVRGIEVLDFDDREKMGNVMLELPILGFIACGAPIEPYTDPNATLGVSPHMVDGSGESYILQAKGDSMIDDGIFEGDYLVIKKQNHANNGDIVVAVFTNGFATLKRFYREANGIRLQPANAAMSPIFVKNIDIRGKVVSVIRKFY